MIRLNDSTPLYTKLTDDDILYYLRSGDADEIETLARYADRVRRARTDGKLHIRALLNISNRCRRNCLYCGLRRGNSVLKRYRMTADEIIGAVDRAVSAGFRTVLLQSGEDDFYTEELVASIAGRITGMHGIALALSLGERPESTLQRWHDRGAARYLLKHETSDEALYRALHPDLDFAARIDTLKILKKTGYETGSGIMIGLPGQTWESVLCDIRLFQGLDIDMIGNGPYIRNPHTPLGPIERPGPDSVTADLKSIIKVTALCRIVTGDTMIPATTATSVLYGDDGLSRVFRAGANVIMADITPSPYRELYEIYPGKGLAGVPADYSGLAEMLNVKYGLEIGSGTGGRTRRG